MKSKKNIVLLSIISMIFVIIAIGVTYAFFNYTRTGPENGINVGRIKFSMTQDNLIDLTNVFPVSSTNLNSSNSDTVTVNISGDTTYSGGIEYKVTIDDVHNTVNGRKVPIDFIVEADDLGTKSNTYYTSRGGNNAVYNLRETGNVTDGELVLVGYIPAGAEGVNGSIDITAYVDTTKVAISDTYSRIENNSLVIGETTGEWAGGREVITTDEWNGFDSSNPLSFRVRVEANEGIWVEEEPFFVISRLTTIQDWKDVRANITSIEFHKDGVEPANPLSSFDATDVTSKGSVTVYTVDDGLGNNTRKAIIVADDVIYAPENCRALFSSMTKLTTFNSENFKVDNVTDMGNLFGGDGKLVNINGLQNWNTSNVTDMSGMFAMCSQLTNINFMMNWNVSNVTTMENMFRQCTNLQNINGLINWNVSNVTTMQSMFRQCTNLQNVNGLVNWNTSNVQNMSNMFLDCTNLQNINGLSNWNTSSVQNMSNMFSNCTNLTDFNPLANWNTENVTTMTFMFGMSASTAKVNNPIIDFSPLSNWNVSKVIDMSAMFQNVNILSYQAFANWNVGKVQNFFATFNATNASTVTTLEGLENWDVSSATNMQGMFIDNVSLTDASAINNWNINDNVNFAVMFENTPVHPEFSRVSGTWDSNGTFTPSVSQS